MKKQVKRKNHQEPVTKKNSRIEESSGESPPSMEFLARAVTQPALQSALTLEKWNTGFGNLDPLALTDALSDQVRAANDGDLGRSEEMLVAQAHTLDAIYNNLARRAARAQGMDGFERNLRLALKAQTQCRATLQTLSEMKYPKATAFVQQANIAQGPQQVNNCPTPPGDAPRPRKTKSRKNKLLEAQDGQRLDTRTTGTAVGADPDLAAVGKLDRSEDG